MKLFFRDRRRCGSSARLITVGEEKKGVRGTLVYIGLGKGNEAFVK